MMIFYFTSHIPDFNLTDAQQEHALAVERLVPRLAALRIELCPGYISEHRYWKIYFVLLHPKLDADDAQFLSTPDVSLSTTQIHLLSYFLYVYNHKNNGT